MTDKRNAHKRYCDYEISKANNRARADYRGREVVRKAPRGLVNNNYSLEEMINLFSKKS